MRKNFMDISRKEEHCIATNIATGAKLQLGQSSFFSLKAFPDLFVAPF